MRKLHISRPPRRLALCFAPAVFALVAGGCNLYFGSEEEWREQEKQECLDELHAQSGGAPIDSFPVPLGATVKAETPPPAISGGTLTISPDQTIAVAADSDRDQVYIVSLETMSLVATIPMLPQDEPGRVAFDDSGRVHVALRRGQNVVSIDLATGMVVGRNKICASPRGIDFDELTGLLYVACHNGKLVTMDPGTGQTVAQAHLESDLRDVVVTDEHVYVSRFRTADLLVLNRDLELLETMRPPGLDTVTFDFEVEGDVPLHFEPAVAWRTVERPSGGVVMVHQRGKDDEIKPSQGGYGSGDPCLGGVVHAAVTPMKLGDPPPVSTALGFMVLPVDMTLIDNGQNAVVVSAGNGAGEERFLPAVVDVPVDTTHRDFDCLIGGEWGSWQGQPIAAASMTDGTVIIQMREPSQLQIFAPGDRFGEPTIIELGTTSVKDTGHQLFHMNTGAGVSCASCHPEGQDDARVWTFQCIGPRRTQSVNIGILGTEPLHWDGDMNTFSTLMSEVFVGRMGGGQPTEEQATFMAEWLDTLRPPPRPEPEDVAAVERGRALFTDPTVGCATCHSGAKFTNNQSYDVGTGGKLQVPSLIGIANRSPFIHTGCAPTLRDRFTNPACGGGDEHGVVSGLSSTQIDDLVAYLETL